MEKQDENVGGSSHSKDASDCLNYLSKEKRRNAQNLREFVEASSDL